MSDTVGLRIPPYVRLVFDNPDVIATINNATEAESDVDYAVGFDTVFLLNGVDVKLDLMCHTRWVNEMMWASIPVIHAMGKTCPLSA